LGEDSQLFCWIFITSTYLHSILRVSIQYQKRKPEIRGEKMKKTALLIGIIVVAIASLLIAGYAFAQTPSPSNPNCPADCPVGDPTSSRPTTPGWGMMGKGQGMMAGRWSQSGDATNPGYGPLHETMFAAMAEALGLTPEELQAHIDSGETMWDIAETQGLTAEKFQEIMIQRRTEAINQAVVDGLITQEQADWMITRMAQMPMYGMGSGASGCPGMGGSGMGGWRWNR
jgi:hypothetical protein